MHKGLRSGQDDSGQMLVGQSGVTMATVITILFNRGNGVNAPPKNWEPAKKKLISRQPMFTKFCDINLAARIDVRVKSRANPLSTFRTVAK